MKEESYKQEFGLFPPVTYNIKGTEGAYLAFACTKEANSP
jgi:hypothetical protein